MYGQIEWSSTYALLQNQGDLEGHEVNVTGHSDGAVYVEIIQPGDNFFGIFRDGVEDAAEFIKNFVGDRFLEPDSEETFNFLEEMIGIED